MARKHARLLVAIWDDKDWLRLTCQQQITYLSLVSSRDLSWAGVAPLLPRRLASVSAEMTERKVRSNLDVLQGEPGRFLVIDEETAEVAVRTFVRHDEILKQPNVTKAMLKDLAKVHSEVIRRSVVSELRRLLRDEPDLRGWDTLRSLDTGLFEEVSANPFRKAS